MPAEETAQGTFFYETARAWGEKELGLFGESAGRHPHLYAGCPAGAVLTGYRGAAGAVSLPARIGGMPVVGVGENAFFGCSPLTDLVIPPPVWRIGENAFAETGLARVSLPDTLRYIDGYAFGGTDLGRVDFPEELIRIGDAAFSDCPLTEVILPDSLRTIGQRAFSSCGLLNELFLPGNITAFWDMESSEGWPDDQAEQFGCLKCESWNRSDAFGGCFSLDLVRTGYPMDIRRTEGKNPLSRAALCHLFRYTPWLEGMIRSYESQAPGPLILFDGIPCPLKEIFSVRAYPGKYMITGMSGREVTVSDLDEWTVRVPAFVDGQPLDADPALFTLRETGDDRRRFILPRGSAGKKEPQ